MDCVDCLKLKAVCNIRKVDIMAIVITNGNHYITYTDSGATKKTTDINSAFQFSTVAEAIKGMKKAEEKTKSYFVFDTLTQRVLWKWMTEEEIKEMRKNKVSLSMVRRDSKGKIKRKSYSEDTRKLIYLHAGGRCELCGRKILLEDMTIDHITPLAMGGEDDVENLSCTCYPCNIFKGNILPSDFMERITDIFLYQMERRHKDRVEWKIVHKMLNKMI